MTEALPALATDAVPLPVRYEAARQALAECEAIDECKGWTDRAAALAVYARQARDTSLHMLALRIQARAERRLGELSKSLPRAQPLNGRGAGLPTGGKTKGDALREAGVSTSVANRAEHVAAIPQHEFDRQVESARPPTVTQLASHGRVSGATATRRPERMTSDPLLDVDWKPEILPDELAAGTDRELALAIDRLTQTNGKSPVEVEHEEIERQAAEIAGLKLQRDAYRERCRQLIELVRQLQSKTVASTNSESGYANE